MANSVHFCSGVRPVEILSRRPGPDTGVYLLASSRHAWYNLCGQGDSIGG